MRAQRVVQHPPLLDHDLCLLQRIENLSIQAFVPQLSVETFTVPVFPGTSRFNVQRPGAQLRQPLPQLLGHEPGPLSERMFSGIPRNSITSANTSITSYLPSLLATRIAKHSRVYS